MARPAGVTAKTKDNSKKLHRNREEWQKGKRIGRPKQAWVFDEPLAVAAGEQPTGHWERTA